MLWKIFFNAKVKNTGFDFAQPALEKMKASTSLSQPWKKMKASTSLSQPAFRIPECSAAESKGPLPKSAPIFFCRKVSAMKGKY